MCPHMASPLKKRFSNKNMIHERIICHEEHNDSGKNWLTVPPGGFQLDRVTNGEGSVFTNVFKHLKVGF